ncbi:MAG TPA: hypothetical protein VFN97_27720 [Actinospica sp.]|nr:hypothetical protein [Actinospica sp.]
MVQEKVDHARRAGRIRARLVFTLIGAAALVVGAFLDWTGSLAGNKLTLRSLVENDFHTRSNMLHTVGAVSVLIAIVAVLSLLDLTGWLTRLAGLAAVVLFAMFAIQVYRHEGQHFGTAYHALQAGVWCQLGGGVVLLIGGLIRYRRRRGPVQAVNTDDTVVHAPVKDEVPLPESASAASADAERERLEPETTVFRPPAPGEIGVGAPDGAVGPRESSSRTS